MPRFRARVEFRRASRSAGWAIAGVTLEDRFWPAQPGVEPTGGRLPQTGLVGWADLPTPILARDVEVGARTALDLAAAAWPDRVRARIPW